MKIYLQNTDRSHYVSKCTNRTSEQVLLDYS